MIIITPRNVSLSLKFNMFHDRSIAWSALFSRFYYSKLIGIDTVGSLLFGVFAFVAAIFGSYDHTPWIPVYLWIFSGLHFVQGFTNAIALIKSVQKFTDGVMHGYTFLHILILLNFALGIVTFRADVVDTWWTFSTVAMPICMTFDGISVILSQLHLWIFFYYTVYDETKYAQKIAGQEAVSKYKNKRRSAKKEMRRDLEKGQGYRRQCSASMSYSYSDADNTGDGAMFSGSTEYEYSEDLYE